MIRRDILLLFRIGLLLMRCTNAHESIAGTFEIVRMIDGRSRTCVGTRPCSFLRNAIIARADPPVAERKHESQTKSLSLVGTFGRTPAAAARTLENVGNTTV